MGKQRHIDDRQRLSRSTDSNKPRCVRRTTNKQQESSKLRIAY